MSSLLTTNSAHTSERVKVGHCCSNIKSSHKVVFLLYVVRDNKFGSSPFAQIIKHFLHKLPFCVVVGRVKQDPY